MIRDYLELARIDHWIKNALVFFPPFFLGVFFEQKCLIKAVPAFLAFSFLSSAIYVINDYLDRENDRVHPVKRKRPIASGRVSPVAAQFFAIGLAVVGFSLVVFAESWWYVCVVMGMYFAANVAYSFRLKHVPLVDIFVLASGFVFRIFYGGFYFGIEVSSWLFLCVFASALFFACGKRKNELRRLGPEAASRPVLRQYSLSFLNAHYYIFCGLAIVFYCLWTISRTNQHAVGKLAITIPLLIFIISRYNLLLDREDSEGDPVPMLLHDNWLKLSALLFVLVNFIILYFGQYLPKINYK